MEYDDGDVMMGWRLGKAGRAVGRLGYVVGGLGRLSPGGNTRLVVGGGSCFWFLAWFDAKGTMSASAGVVGEGSLLLSVSLSCFVWI